MKMSEVNEFAALCRKSQKDLKKYLFYILEKRYKTVIFRDGFLYAQGDVPILLIAHMDTVHKELPDKIYYDEASTIISSPQGIGGDDRCGIYMILDIIKTHKVSVLFCEDEEIGGVGAEKFVDFLATNDIKGINVNYNYIIEFDRANADDAVFYDCDNADFTNFITQSFYTEALGSFSDISVVAPRLGVAAVNLSCGYHKPHTVDEYVVMEEMRESINAAKAIIERTDFDKDKFEYVEAKYEDCMGWEKYFRSDGVYCVITYRKEDGKYTYEDDYGVNEAEVVGKFLMRHPEMSYSELIVETEKY